MADEPLIDDIEAGAADRLIFFSDAVVAIAMTLLALGLPVPSGATVHRFWLSVGANSGEYLAFLISFVVIALHWSAHHRAFRYLARGGERLRELNMLWLLTIVLMPFATDLLSVDGKGADQTEPVRFASYALLQVLADVVFLAMVHRIVTHGLVRSNTPPRFVQAVDRRVFGLVIGFGLSIPLFFVFHQAWVLWIAGPVITHQLWKRLDRPGRRIG